jgi:predicted phage gp36 major capsid-like protein
VNAARSQALRAIESHDDLLTSDAADRLDRLVNPNRDPSGLTARYLAAVGSPDYSTAFLKMLGDPVTGHLRFTREEATAVQHVSELTHQRAMSLTGSAGGFAVPFQLDPTVLLSSGGSASPLRQIARVETVSVDEWRGFGDRHETPCLQPVSGVSGARSGGLRASMVWSRLEESPASAAAPPRRVPPRAQPLLVAVDFLGCWAPLASS